MKTLRQASRANSAYGSKSISRDHSETLGETSDVIDDFATVNDSSKWEQENMQMQIKKLEENLQAIAKRHKEVKSLLISRQNEELQVKEQTTSVHLRDHIADQETEMTNLFRKQEAEIKKLIELHEREINMRKNIHDAECKALLERRLLNSVLDSVVDGILTIQPNGTIVRFNPAAEKMFGYSASEVIGTLDLFVSRYTKDQLGKNIRMLMPQEHSVNHDQYLNNYLTTGVKKVIGSGRRLHGLKKNGQQFPVYLSVSEVKDDESHVFTGIVRDLTEEVTLEENATKTKVLKQKELEKVISQLDRFKVQADNLISHMLPPSVAKTLMNGEKVAPQTFDNCTIFFSDIVGFTELSSKSAPQQIVSFLNGLYIEFDKIISKYDAYKVETIGDAYMIVSGVPHPNGNNHASEIATMALELISCVNQYQIAHIPDRKLQIRVGLHTGPVLAGVVGKKMPRYCLYVFSVVLFLAKLTRQGGSVAIASKMESTSEAMKVQVSETTYQALEAVGGFFLAEKGQLEIKVDNLH